MILCGHCKSLHSTVAAVRACADSEALAPSAFRSNPEASEQTDLHALLRQVDVMLVTRDVPESDWRWSRAIRAMISGTGDRVTELALKVAIARLETYPEISPRSGKSIATSPMMRMAATNEGLYRLDGRLYQVVRSGSTQRLYAKLVTFRPNNAQGKKVRPLLTYAGGVIYDLTPDHLLPIEEAQEITRKTGWCIFGHFLTNPKSIARGMGDTCYARYPHLAKNVA